jgi:short-subunit dehydrogenase
VESALITGAAGGIGLELARLFARDSVPLLLVDRDCAGLEQAQSEFGAGCRTLCLDLSSPESITEVWNWSQSLAAQVGYLVNNAGFGQFGQFSQIPWQNQQKMIAVNITALTGLTHYFLPPMIERQKGKILNLASIAALQPGPMLSVYSATKAYVLSFSQALAEELAESGITVTALCPGPTRSNFEFTAGAQNSGHYRDQKLPSAREVAEFGYRALQKGRRVAIHGSYNRWQAALVRVLPSGVVTKAVRRRALR